MCRWQFFTVDCVLVPSTKKQHEIVTMVQRILRLTNVDYAMFERWCKSSSNQFRIKNMNGLAYENISDSPYDTQCDARTILQMKNRHKQAINLLSTELTTMKQTDEIVQEHFNVELANDLKCMKNVVSILLQFMKQLHPINLSLMMSTSSSESKVTNDTVSITVAPHDLTLNPSFHGWFVNHSICQSKNVIEIFIH